MGSGKSGTETHRAESGWAVIHSTAPHRTAEQSIPFHFSVRLRAVLGGSWAWFYAYIIYMERGWLLWHGIL